MPVAYRHMDLDERRKIFRLLDQNRPITDIAEALGRHRSTVYREIARNKVNADRETRRLHYWKYGQSEGYFPVTADECARRRRQRQRKLVRQPDLYRYVVDKLQAAWSPEQIAGRLKVETVTTFQISHETIYQHAYSAEGHAAGIPKLLPKARRQRRSRFGRKPRASFIPTELAIHRRPKDVENRQNFGHWEADLMIFRRANGKANVTTLVERQSRYTLLLRNLNRQSAPLVSAISSTLQDLPKQACKTITFDRGTEFASYALLTEQRGFNVYFCDPHAPWQKGSVENTNGRVRRFLPSETNLAELPHDALSQLTARLNNTPRKCLGYRTPNEDFQDRLAGLPQAEYNPKPMSHFN